MMGVMTIVTVVTMMTMIAMAMKMMTMVFVQSNKYVKPYHSVTKNSLEIVVHVLIDIPHFYVEKNQPK